MIENEDEDEGEDGDGGDINVVFFWEMNGGGGVSGPFTFEASSSQDRIERNRATNRDRETEIKHQILLTSCSMEASKVYEFFAANARNCPN